MNVRPLDAAARKTLLDDAGVEELLAHLRLARGFALFVVPVPTPKIGRALLRLVDEERKIHRGAGATIRALQPHDVLPRTAQPVSVDALADVVLRPLFEGAPTDERLTWVDATTARPDDDDAWRAVLRMWNERRNSFIAQHAAPVVLAVPYRFERVLADAAPDLWSVRNGVFRVRVADLELHLLPLAKGAEATHEERPRTLSLVLAALSEAPVQFSAPSRALVMSQSAGDLLARGELDHAKALSVGSLEHARAASAATPENVDTLRLLYRALQRDAEVDFYRHDAASVHTSQEALSVAEQLGRMMPEAREPIEMQIETLRRITVAGGGQSTDVATIARATELALALLEMAPDDEKVRELVTRTMLMRADLLQWHGAGREFEQMRAEIDALRPLSGLAEVESQAQLALWSAVRRAHEESVVYWADALRRLRTLRPLEILSVERLRLEINYLGQFAAAQMRLGDFNGALATASELASAQQSQRTPHPFIPISAKFRAARIRCEAQLELGRLAEAQVSAEELRSMLPPPTDRASLPSARRVEVAHALAVLADLNVSKREADALRCEAREILPSAESLSAPDQIDLSDVLHRLDRSNAPPPGPIPDRDTLAT